MMRNVALAAVLALSGSIAGADFALYIGEPGEGQARQNNTASLQTLRARGFDVTKNNGTTLEGMREALGALLASASPEDQIVIYLTGEFARSGEQTWFLERRAPENLSLVDVGSHGVDIMTVMEIAGRAPGGALVILAREDGTTRLGKGLRTGITTGDIPQGVAVLLGEPADTAVFLADQLLGEGLGLQTALRGQEALSGRGYITDRFSLAAQPVEPTEAKPAAPSEDIALQVERTVWLSAKRQATSDAFQSYLDRYPAGRFADEAKSELAALRDDPVERARRREEALELSRQDKRRIQQGLNILGFDPRGIDGIFGPASRAAIKRYQESLKVDETGYLRPKQIERLDELAAAKQAE
ncbi:MAG: peptidoglycan-binding protein, partial [Pseudomonadota bacterium]